MIPRLSKIILICGCWVVANGLPQWLTDVLKDLPNRNVLMKFAPARECSLALGGKLQTATSLFAGSRHAANASVKT